MEPVVPGGNSLKERVLKIEVYGTYGQIPGFRCSVRSPIEVGHPPKVTFPIKRVAFQWNGVLKLLPVTSFDGKGEFKATHERDVAFLLYSQRWFVTCNLEFSSILNPISKFSLNEKLKSGGGGVSLKIYKLHVFQEPFIQQCNILTLVPNKQRQPSVAHLKSTFEGREVPPRARGGSFCILHSPIPFEWFYNLKSV